MSTVFKWFFSEKNLEDVDMESEESERSLKYTENYSMQSEELSNSFEERSSRSSGKSEESLDDKIDNLAEVYDEITIVTSRRKFCIAKCEFGRLSEYIVDEFLNAENQKGDSIKVRFERSDHDAFKFIYRYIRYGFKINLNLMCKKIGITREDGLYLLKDWGYGESIYV
jgi:hypothetical protein